MEEIVREIVACVAVMSILVVPMVYAIWYEIKERKKLEEELKIMIQEKTYWVFKEAGLL